jgi:hypothetical protein
MSRRKRDGHACRRAADHSDGHQKNEHVSHHSIQRRCPHRVSIVSRGNRVEAPRTQSGTAGDTPLQKRGFRRWLTSSNLPASQFDEDLWRCQSCHAIKAPVITIAVPKATNNGTINAIIDKKVSVIAVQPFASRKITSL